MQNTFEIHLPHYEIHNCHCTTPAAARARSKQQSRLTICLEHDEAAGDKFVRASQGNIGN